MPKKKKKIKIEKRKEKERKQMVHNRDLWSFNDENSVVRYMGIAK